eukprot:XP_011661682.1 PREDICTED: uncharacterized protein LOC100888467 [Strongylocentrotus purpuratus]
MDILQYSGQPIHRGGQIPANGQNFDPTVAALVSSMRQDLVPESSTPIPHGYSSFSPNSTQMDIYSPVSQADFRSQISPVTSKGYRVQDVTYDYGQESEQSRKHHPQNGRTSPMVQGRGFMITGTPSPRSSLDGSRQPASYQHHQSSHHHHHHSPSLAKQGDGGLINNNSSYVTYNDSLEYTHNNSHPSSNMAPQNGYVSPPLQSYHPVSTYCEEIQFGTSGTVGSGGDVISPAQLCHSAVTQNGVSAPDGIASTAKQPKPPTSLKPRGSRTRRSLRRAADMLLNRSRQSLSDTESRAPKVMTPVPPSTASPRSPRSTADMPGNEENRVPSVRERLQKNRARMGELLRSPSLSKWRRGSKENLDVSNDQPKVGSPSSNVTSPAYVPNRRYRSAENLNTSSYTSYETPDPYLDSRTDGSNLDSSDGMSTRSVESTPADYPPRHQERRHSVGQARHRTRSRENHRGYHTADSDTDSSYSRHDGTNGDSHSRYNSKRPLPSSFRLLSKGNRDGPMRTTPKGPSGPLKADHSIQPFTKEKRSPDEGSPRDMWAEQGARPKHHSSTDSLETEQVTHIVFQDTPIRNDSDEKNPASSSSRPTTPSALRKSSRPASPSRSVRFDDDTDGSYDSDRRERKAQSSRRSESPAGRQHSNGHDSRQQNRTSNGRDMPMYATVDKSRKSRTPSRQDDERMSRHDIWTNGVEKDDPYSTIRINDDSYVSQNGRSRTESDYEEVTFRPRSEIVTSRSHDSKQGIVYQIFSPTSQNPDHQDLPLLATAILPMQPSTSSLPDHNPWPVEGALTPKKACHHMATRVSLTQTIPSSIWAQVDWITPHFKGFSAFNRAARLSEGDDPKLFGSMREENIIFFNVPCKGLHFRCPHMHIVM